MSLTIPSATQPNRWVQRFVSLVTLVASLLSLSGAFYQSLSERRDLSAHPISGELVDVGTYQLHVYCTGSGSPAVILDSGLGDGYVSWRKVQPLVAPFTRVCSYDRAGLGYSFYRRQPPTSRNIAEELHTLLHNAGISPPYVLAGHSMGGFDVRLYASLFGDEVAGMVLVDSSHPEQQKRFPAALNDVDASWLRQAEFLEFTMPFAIPRLLGFCSRDGEVRSAECNFHSAQENVAELKAFAESAAQAAASGSLGDVPLAVISHDPGKPEPDLPEDLVKPFNDSWEQMQEELARLSTHSTHIIARNSGHYIQLDRPDVVAEAIRNVVEEARRSAASKP